MNTTFTNYAEKKAKQFLNLLQGYTKGIRITAILILLLMGVSNAWAEPWLCRSTAGGKIATKTVGDKLNNGNEWNYEYTTNGGWSSATDIQVYVGTSTSSYTTVNAGWKSDDGGNKNVAANIGSVSFDKSGKWYAVGKYKADGKTAYTTKKDEWTNNTTLSMGSNDEPYWEVTPPAVSNFTVSVSGYLSGTGTSNDPYIVQYGKALTVNLSGSKAKTDANSTLQYNTSGTWNTTTSRTISNITSATKTSVTVKMRCHNSTASLSGTESSKTIYYRAENLYTVTFNANGHGTAPDAQTVTQGSKATEPTPAPQETGYTFGGWYTDQACSNGKEWDFNTTITADITLYAKWTPNNNTSYVVKHCKEDLNGNYPAELTETENLTGTTDSEVTPSVKSYEGFTAPSTQTVTIQADGSLVVTYKYTRNKHTLTWNLDGGDITKAGTAAGEVAYGATLTAPTVEKDGYRFTGWNPAVPATMPDYDVTCTAQWEKNTYTVTYGVVGAKYGTIALNKTSAIEGQNTQNLEHGTELTFTATPTTGYQILGWYSDEAGEESLGNGTAATYTINSLTSAESVYVAFEKMPANTYNVAFDANGGTGTMSTQQFTYDIAQRLSPVTFKRTGYDFTDWNTAADGSGTSYTDGQEVINLTPENGATVTLYAQWTANTYTVNLDQEGATTKGTLSVTATYDAAMPTLIELPTKNGYGFMGYWDGKDGSGTQYYNADGTSASTWNKETAASLYAYFKKAEITNITLDNNLFESGEAESVTVTSYTIEPTPAGIVVVCWTLCYTNGTPVEEHDAIKEDGTVKFSLEGLSAGTYKIVASLRLNDCNGEELDTAEATFVVAGSYTVTIKYTYDGQEIAGRTTIEGHPSKPTAVTAAEIGGYNFVKWVLGDGITSTSTLTNKTINITANYEGYLTATYEKKKLIFLDLSKKFGTANWTAPHIYLYSAEFWNENLGTGATDPKCVAKGAMSPVPGTTGMWFYEYEGVNNFNGYVAFTPTDKKDQANFYDTEVIHRGDFSIGTPVFVPAEGQTANIKNPSEGKNAQYYNKGHWTKYMGGTGYTLKIYNHKEEEGRKELMSVPFTGSSLYLPFTAVVDLESGQTFGYKIVRDNDKWYKNDNDGTMTVNSHTNWPFVEDNSNGLACGIQTVAAGNHTFKLTLNATSGNFEVTVDYPVTVGDYRILYKDDTRTTYKPSDIKKAEELNPVTSFFIRPNSDPELKIQTAAHITDGDVTWYTADNHIYFKPNDLWKEASARFAAYFYNGSKNEWKELTKNGDIYSCEKPSGYTHVIFVRLNPAGKGDSKNNNGLHWNYKWNQTGHLSIPKDDNLYELKEGIWGNKIYLKPNSNWLQKEDGTGTSPRFAAYFYEDGKGSSWMSMNDDGDGIYSCDIPAENNKKVIFCRMTGANATNDWAQKWNQTNDLTVPTDGKLLYTVKDDTWDKGGGTWSVGEGTWNKITGSITDLTEELKKKLGEINGDIGKAPDSVYTIHLEQNNGTFSVAKVVPYSGNFYIRVDAAAGKWYDYKTNPDNLMTYSAFSESDANSFGEKFSHYKTEWCSDGMNVKFVIANDYSQCISDTLVQDTENSLGNIDEYGNLKNEDKYNANIRFMWNRSTNKVSRAYVAAATNDEKKFLVLKTDKPIKNNKDQSVNEIIFQDTQNWIYEYTIKAQPGTRVKLYACYPEVNEATAQHFRGKYNNPTTFDENNSVQILGGTGDAWNTIRVLYDFKTNRLMGAWVPESAISTEQAIAADLMVIRRHQENATCVTLTNENSKLTDVKTAYGAMQFNRWILNNRGGADDHNVTHSTVEGAGGHRVYDENITNQHHPVLPLAEQTSVYERGLYFISFPFDVHLSDVFGFGTYGTHWVISTYNGKRRAERGYFEEDCVNEDCTNWDYIWDPTDFVMEANVGYLLSIDLDLMKHDNTQFWSNNINQVELFFPSTAAISSIEKTDYTMPALGEEYLCKINHNTPDGDRRVKDSYWRCIGVPSFADYDGSLTDGKSAINWKDDYTWKADNGAFPFLYEWNVTNNDLVVRSTNSYKFRATYAYLIQNGNEIHWEAVNTNKPASIIARDQSENMSNYEWKIALLRNDAPADHTFIRMTDNESVTSAFDFHQDLAKEFNYGANIYTLVGYERLAANSLPMSDSTTIIPLGVSAQEAGDYTITMPEGVESIGITLVDTETGTRTNLCAGMEYTFTLNRGTYDSRLYLEISPIEKTPSDLEYVDEATRNQNVRKFIIDGKLYLQKDGMLYDAQGHIVR